MILTMLVKSQLFFSHPNNFAIYPARKLTNQWNVHFVGVVIYNVSGVRHNQAVLSSSVWAGAVRSLKRDQMCSSKFSVNQKNLFLIRPEGNLTEQTHLDFRFMTIPPQHPCVKRKKRGGNWQGWQFYGMAPEGWANQLLIWGYLSTDLLLTGRKNHDCQMLLKHKSLSGCQAYKACYFDAACLNVEGLLWKLFSLIDVVFPFGFLGKWSK